MPPRKRAAKDEEPTKVVEPETTLLDTQNAVDPNEDSSDEPTPIADQLTEDLKNAKEEDLTHFEEDDDPLTNAGVFVDEDGDGVDDRKENE